MRSDAPGPEYVAAGLMLHSTVDVWYAGEVTAHAVPVAGGRFVVQRDQEVPERLDLTVPLEHEGKTLDPERTMALGKDGHELAVTVHLATLDGQRRWAVRVPRCQVQSWSRVEAGVKLSAHGLLRKVKGHLRPAPRSARGPSMIYGELSRELADVGFRTRMHPALVDRALSRDFVFGTDRLESVLELVAAWPARVRVDADGVVEFLPPLTRDPGVPVVHLHDGEGGTITGAPSEGSREAVFNRVIVRVKSPDDAPTWPVVIDVDSGRLAVATYGVEAREIDNAVMTVAQAQSVGWQELELSKMRSRTVPVQGAPDWRIEVDDPGMVTTHLSPVPVSGRFTGVDLPLTSGDGPARYDVGVID